MEKLIEPVLTLQCSQQQKLTPIVPVNGAEMKNEWKKNNDRLFFIRENNVIRRLEIDDIQYVEAMGDYVKFHTPKKLYITHCTLKAVELKLPGAYFLRIHRSFIVALNKLDCIQDGGLVIGDRFIPIADNYRRTLHNRLDIL